MDNRIYELYKRILKHDMKAIEEIETLEEAKEIIKIIVFNPIFFGLSWSR